MTLDIKILGPGCANCYRLEGLAVAAVQFLQSQKPELFQDVEVTLDHLSTPSDFFQVPRSAHAWPRRQRKTRRRGTFANRARDHETV